MIRANRRNFIFEQARKHFRNLNRDTMGIIINGYRVTASRQCSDNLVFIFTDPR